MTLPPYIERPDEDLISKCRRIREELQALARRRPCPAVNDNEPERVPMWWERD